MKMYVIIPLTLLFSVTTFAQTYTLKSYCIDGGGVSCMNAGSYTFGLSIGQPFTAIFNSGGLTAYIGYLTKPVAPPGIEEAENPYGSDQPVAFSLGQNYPNPVICRTSIKYSIAKQSRVQLRLFDISGRQIASLVDQNQKPGYYQINWNIGNVQKQRLSNGIYFYRLTAGDFTDTKKMVVVR